MRPQQRLRSSRDIATVQRRGRAAHGRAMSVRVLPRPDSGGARFTVTAGRRVGSAVTRNRAKRRLRAAVREAILVAGTDSVITAKAPAATMPFTDLVSELRGLLAQTAPSGNGPDSSHGGVR